MRSTREIWLQYVECERRALAPILAKLGYELESTQPHLLGERHLAQAVTTQSGRKLVLLARRQDGLRVVIKATRDPSGKRELFEDRECRRVLHEIDFAYELFTSPRELYFDTQGGFLISIQEFIEQESTFLARPLKEQFAYALGAFKAQEGAHATTYGHRRRIRRTFGSFSAADYPRLFGEFCAGISALRSGDTRLGALLAHAASELARGKETIDRYGDFLVHTDFIPQNIRIRDGQIYLLDYSSLRFGNKYEGWARFVNFMALYNPPLARALIEYIGENRTSEESRALTLMRLYRLAELIWHHTRNLPHTEGDLRELTELRITFWSDMLEALLEGQELTEARVHAYTTERDRLRSEEEKLRQRELH